MKLHWSRHYDKCVECGATDRSHVAVGLCHKCYNRHWVDKHRQRITRYKHDWWVASGGTRYSKMLREQRHFGGLREAVLQRDGNKCCQCGSWHQLLVHHKDGNGRGVPEPINQIDNLITLCRKCHMDAHRPKLQAGRGFVGDKQWSAKYGLNACRKCGRSDRPHNGDGLCHTCYSNARYANAKQRH